MHQGLLKSHPEVTRHTAEPPEDEEAAAARVLVRRTFESLKLPRWTPHGLRRAAVDRMA